MGNAATLTCQYDLDNVSSQSTLTSAILSAHFLSLSQASLYSVRWYFESEEFYRFVPKEAPPARTFQVAGITVDVSVPDDLREFCKSFNFNGFLRIQTDFHSIDVKIALKIVQRTFKFQKTV
jgi:hypothetical protein